MPRPGRLRTEAKLDELRQTKTAFNKFLDELATGKPLSSNFDDHRRGVERLEEGSTTTLPGALRAMGLEPKAK
jgi:hypothetical protein